MTTFAYDVEYVELSQKVMGDMMDYAVNTLNYELDDFYKMFLVSSISKQIEIGNPAYVAGKNGCELARLVIEEALGERLECEDAMYVDKSEEYWIGWTLAYYQWNSARCFKEINALIPVGEFYGMYNTLHEADITKTLEIIDGRFDAIRQESTLKRLRRYAKMSQSMLAKESGVAIRQIQLFEQGQRDIKKAQAETVLALANTLKCDVQLILKQA